MRNLKKFLALVLAMMMVFSLMITVNAATSDTANKYQGDFDKLKLYKVVTGTGDATDSDNLGGNFTRAQMAGIAYRLATGDVSNNDIGQWAVYAAENFSDVKETDWFAGWVGFCQIHNLVKGYNGKFNPNDPVDGHTVAVLLLRLLGFTQKNEFTGSNWRQEATSNTQLAAITRGMGSVDMSNPEAMNRGIALHMTANAAFEAKKMEFDAIKGTYSPIADTTKDNLIENTTKVTTQDDWGAPTTTQNYTFTYPIAPKTDKYTVKNEAKVFYEAMTECDVANLLGEKAEFSVTTYINGKSNKNLSSANTVLGGVGVDTKKDYKIQPEDTTNTIGAQGRETAIYANPGNIEGVTGKYIVVYKDIFLAEVTNVVAPITDTGTHVVNKPGTYGTIFGGSVYAADLNGALLSTSITDYVKGDLLTVNVLTGANNDLATATLSSAAKNAAAITPTRVTVDGIKRVGPLGSYTYTGFTADSATYLYSVLWDRPSNRYSFRLTDTAINGTFDVYSNGHGSVLALKDATGNGYGVVTDFDTEKLSGGKYLLTLDIQTEEGAVTLQTYGRYTVPFASVAAAENEGNFLKDSLVHYVRRGEYFQLDIVAGKFGMSDFYGGRATAINSTTAKVNEDTVFFVADYTLKNSTEGYMFNGYSVKHGFKDIADHLKVDGARNKVDGSWIGGNLIVSFIDIDVPADGWADYVMIVNGTEVSTNAAQAVNRYAYIMDGTEHVTIRDNVYVYDAVRDGTAGPLDVNYNSWATIFASGLYRLTEYTNGGWTVADTGGSLYIPGNFYDYKAGVLIFDPNGLAGGPNYSRTVADNAEIYIVNETTVDSFPGGDVESVLKYYVNKSAAADDECPIYYQLDSKGYISLIYVIDNNANGAYAPDANPKTYSLNIGNTFWTNWIGNNADIWVNGVKVEPTHEIAGYRTISGLKAGGKIEIDHGRAVNREQGSYVLDISLDGGRTVKGQVPVYVDENGVATIMVNDLIKLVPSSNTSSTISFTITNTEDPDLNATRVIVQERKAVKNAAGDRTGWTYETIKTEYIANSAYSDATGWSIKIDGEYDLISGDYDTIVKAPVSSRVGSGTTQVSWVDGTYSKTRTAAALTVTLKTGEGIAKFNDITITVEEKEYEEPDPDYTVYVYYKDATGTNVRYVTIGEIGVMSGAKKVVFKDSDLDLSALYAKGYVGIEPVAKSAVKYGFGTNYSTWTSTIGSDARYTLTYEDGVLTWECGVAFNASYAIEVNPIVAADADDYKEGVGTGTDARGFYSDYAKLGIKHTVTTDGYGGVITFDISVSHFQSASGANSNGPLSTHTNADWAKKGPGKDGVQYKSGDILIPCYAWLSKEDQAGNPDKMNGHGLIDTTDPTDYTDENGNIMGIIGVNFATSYSTAHGDPSPGKITLYVTDNSTNKTTKSIVDVQSGENTVSKYFRVATKDGDVVNGTGMWTSDYAVGESHSWTITYVDNGVQYTWTVIIRGVV